MAKLTTRSLASGVTVDDLIHIVITGDTSQDSAGSSYKASIKQVFDAITGYCISDLYVSNIHSCSPLRINPLDEGNVYFGSNSGVTIDISSGGNIMNLGSVNIQSDNSINPYSIVADANSSNTKGFIVNFDNPDTNLIQSANNNTSGSTRVKASSLLGSNKHIQLEYGGDDYIRTAIAPVNGFDFYKNRGILSIGRNSGGMIINISPTGNTGNLWFEQNGNSIMYLKGGPSPSDGSLGLALNPDGTETPSANLQVGGTGTTGTFKYVDGNESNGYVLTSDNDGNATWQPSSGGTDTNFANTDLTFTGNRTHDIGTSNYLYITNDPTFSTVSSFLYLAPNETQIGNYDISNPLYLGFSGGSSYFQSNINKVFSIKNNLPGCEIIVNEDNLPSVTFNVKGGLDDYLITSDPVSDRVGIGTNTPSEKLEVSGNTKITGGLNIGNIGGTTSITNLGIDINGNVVSGTTGGSSFFTGGTVNGPTNFTNGLSADTISATTYYNLPGSSSANCFTDFYVTNVHGCSPISIWDEVQTRTSNAYGILSFAFGDHTKTYGDYSYANGLNTNTGSDGGYLVNSCTAGVCILDSSYGDTTADYITGSTAFVVFDDMDYSANYSTYLASVSAVTWNGTNTIIYLNDIYLDTFGQPGVITNTYAPTGWLGDQVFGGKYTKTNGKGSIAIGLGSSAEGEDSHSIGNYSSARNTSIAYGPYSSSEGKSTYTYGIGSHSEGQSTSAIGIASHAEGAASLAIGDYSHAEGSNTIASGITSHAEGSYSVASGDFSHSEGSSTASGIFSHAEGDSSVASGQYAHSQNKGTQAIGGSTHAGGFGGIARGEVSFSHGVLTEANGPTTAVLGGDLNIISSGGTYGSAILGGSGNTITYLSLTDNVTTSAIIGGSGNTVTSFESVIVGGDFNNVTAPRSVILGGTNITANASDTTYVPNFVITESYTPTGSADTAGEPGSITWDNTYLYYKTNTGWRRLSGSTF